MSDWLPNSLDDDKYARLDADDPERVFPLPALCPNCGKPWPCPDAADPAGWSHE